MVAPAGGVLDTPGDDGEERVGDVGHDEGDRPRPLGAELAGHRVGHVAELGDGPIDATSDGFARVTGTVDDPRDGHRRHARELRDIPDGGHRIGTSGIA